MKYTGGLTPGVLVDQWHDEGRTFHLLRDDGSPVCGVRYYTTNARPDLRYEDVSCTKCRNTGATRGLALPAEFKIGKSRWYVKVTGWLDAPSGMIFTSWNKHVGNIQATSLEELKNKAKAFVAENASRITTEKFGPFSKSNS